MGREWDRPARTSDSVVRSRLSADNGIPRGSDCLISYDPALVVCCWPDRDVWLYEINKNIWFCEEFDLIFKHRYTALGATHQVYKAFDYTLMVIYCIHDDSAHRYCG